MTPLYRNGRPAAPGDRVLDVNSGDIFIVECLDPDCPTANVRAVPAFATALDLRSVELMRLDDARAILAGRSIPTFPPCPPGPIG
jgi:hypothetical protein